MIEFYSPRKRVWVKAVAIILTMSFLWYDVAMSADLFYYSAVGRSAAPRPISPEDHPLPEDSEAHDPTVSEELEYEVTNYDLLYYKRRKSIAEKLLPSKHEVDQQNRFSPAYLQEAQMKHEEVIRLKQDSEDIMWLLKKNIEPPPEDWELQKKKSGMVPQGGPEPIKYTLSDWDGEGNPQQIDIYDYEPDGSLKSITSYDISGLDADRWINAGKEMEGKDGKKFYGSTMDPDMTDLEDYLILNKMVYSGSKGEEIIDHILADYDEEGNANLVKIYDYSKISGEALDEVREYDVEGLDIDLEKERTTWDAMLTQDLLVRTTVYEGAKGEEKAVYVYDDYAVDEEGNNTPNQISIYDYEDDDEKKNLDETRGYDISELFREVDWEETLADLRSNDEDILADYKDKLISRSEFDGKEGAEKIQQTFDYDEGELIERKDFEYEEYSAQYSEHKRRKLLTTLTYDTDIELLSEEGREERGAGELTGENIFLGWDGHELIEQDFVWQDGEIVTRRDYEYDERNTLKNIFAFDVWGDEITLEEKKNKSDMKFAEDGTIDFENSDFTGILEEESDFEGRKGKELIQQNFSYVDGEIEERKDYDYEGRRLTNIYTFDLTEEEGSESAKRQMSKFARNEDGTIDFENSEFTGILEEESVFDGRRGKEQIQQSFTYEDNAITERKDYAYEGRALKNVYTFDVYDTGTEAAKREMSDIAYAEDGTIDFEKSSFSGELEEESVFDGRRGKEQIQQSFTYEDEAITERKDYAYEGRALKNVYTFDV
ncbi:MAG: hypothetical protein ABIJ27_05045, partial [Candidatus Omnitrophota bacterium]